MLVHEIIHIPSLPPPSLTPSLPLSLPPSLLPQMLNAYGPLLYQIGLADENQLEHINNETAKGVQFIQAGQYYEAFVVRGHTQC